MDKSWKELIKGRRVDEMEEKVTKFFFHVFVRPSRDRDGKLWCPCFKCGSVKRVPKREAFDHVICDGFLQGLEVKVQRLKAEVQVLKQSLTTVISLFEKQFPGENEEILNTIASMINQKVCKGIYIYITGFIYKFIDFLTIYLILFVGT